MSSTRAFWGGIANSDKHSPEPRPTKEIPSSSPATLSEVPSSSLDWQPPAHSELAPPARARGANWGWAGCGGRLRVRTRRGAPREPQRWRGWCSDTDLRSPRLPRLVF
eukprot:15445727-Alexandrium_andersonii.AAC.1